MRKQITRVNPKIDKRQQLTAKFDLVTYANKVAELLVGVADYRQLTGGERNLTEEEMLQVIDGDYLPTLFEGRVHGCKHLWSVTVKSAITHRETGERLIIYFDYDFKNTLSFFELLNPGKAKNIIVDYGDGDVEFEGIVKQWLKDMDADSEYEDYECEYAICTATCKPYVRQNMASKLFNNNLFNMVNSTTKPTQTATA